jgi:DNA-binding ferritin-like protein (Dps family)
MQKYLKYLTSLFIFISFLIAQVTEGMVKFNLGEHNALKLRLIDVDKKLVEREWKLYTKPYGKIDKKKGEWLTKGVNLEGLSNTVDWYMKLDKNKKDIIIKLCVISNEEFLSSSNQSGNYEVIENYLKNFENYLKNFVFVVEKAKVNKEFESEKKALASLQKKLKKLSGNYANSLKSIEKYTKKIKSAEKGNKSNLKKQAEIRENISKQGLIIEEILSNPSDSIQEGEVSLEYKEANEKLLKLQKKLGKLVDDYEANLKTIDKSINKIEKAEKGNKSNLKDQTKTKKQITEQGQLVEKIRKQLESMR